MKWVINQKRYRPGHFIGGILVLAAEMTLLSISLLFFSVALSSRKTDWYALAMEQQVSTDIFAGQRTDSIFAALSVVVIFVLLFAVMSLCIFRRLQLEGMQRQLGVFLTCGYRRPELERMLGLDTGIDILVSAPFAVYMFSRVLGILSLREEFLVMLESIHMNKGSYGILFLVCMVILYLVTGCYSKVWMKKSVKGGLAYMLRQNG